MKVTISHEGRQVEFLLEGRIYGGSSKRMNPPSKAHPAEPPSVSFDKVEITWDELDRDLDTEEVFCEHDTELVDEFIRRKNNRAL